MPRKKEMDWGHPRRETANRVVTRHVSVNRIDVLLANEQRDLRCTEDIRGVAQSQFVKVSIRAGEHFSEGTGSTDRKMQLVATVHQRFGEIYHVTLTATEGLR